MTLYLGYNVIAHITRTVPAASPVATGPPTDVFTYYRA